VALIRARERSARRVPIVALTAHDAANYREKCVQADMDDILNKPYTLEDCTRLLRRWLPGAAAGAPAQDVRFNVDSLPSMAPGSALSRVAPQAGARVRTLRAGQRVDLYSSLVELFRTGSTQSLAQLRSALTGGDLQT